jgi:hypothetical protein
MSEASAPDGATAASPVVSTDADAPSASAASDEGEAMAAAGALTDARAPDDDTSHEEE